MYKIVGADHRHYGPVTMEQIRAWIADGRAGGQTLAQLEGATDWKPLGTFPEFVDALAAKAPSPPSLTGAPPTSRRDSRQTAAGVCGILLGSFGIHKFVLGYTMAGVIMLLVTVLTCGIGGFVIHIIGLIEGIMYLSMTDEEFARVHGTGSKEWF